MFGLVSLLVYLLLVSTTRTGYTAAPYLLRTKATGILFPPSPSRYEACTLYGAWSTSTHSKASGNHRVLAWRCSSIYY
ncbi:hypothetical protein V8C37DRAFT_376160 [Trichoderma ceciliae]